MYFVLQVLGLRELRQLVQWRKKMRQFLDEVGSSSNNEQETGREREGQSQEEKMEDEEDANLAKIDKKVEQLTQAEQAEVKRYEH